MEKKKLTQVGLAAMERLDLPGQLAADVPQMQLTGKNDFYMLGHKGVLSYSTELIEISGARCREPPAAAGDDGGGAAHRRRG